MVKKAVLGIGVLMFVVFLTDGHSLGESAGYAFGCMVVAGLFCFVVMLVANILFGLTDYASGNRRNRGR